MRTTIQEISHYTYCISWSVEDQGFVATCLELPALSWLATSQDAAPHGLRDRVDDVVDDLQRNGEQVPEPLSSSPRVGKVGHATRWFTADRKDAHVPLTLLTPNLHGAVRNGAGVTRDCRLRTGRHPCPATDDGSPVRVVWWGNDKRTELTQEALDSFAAAHPGGAIAPEPTEWGGYWDKLATQVAAQDAPDLIQMDEKYLLEYARRGALADLGTAIDTTVFAPGTVELGEADGTLYAINAGTIAPVLMANPELFEQAGVPIPDDAAWTWDDLKQLAITLTTNLPAGSYGLTDFSGRDAAFRVWVRQNGVETFTDGQLGFGPDVAASFFAMAKDLMDSGATPPASQSTEDVSAPVAQRLFSTGLTAMAIYSSNQITAFDAATGKDLRLLRLPSRDGTPAGARLAYQASMYWCVMSQATNPERAAQLASYLVNDEAAGRILLTERGVPANTQVLAAIQGDLSASDMKAIAYLDSLEPHLAPTPSLTPQGASSFEDVLIRHGQDVLFGRTTPQAAGEAFVNEMRAAIG